MSLFIELKLRIFHKLGKRAKARATIYLFLKKNKTVIQKSKMIKSKEAIDRMIIPIILVTVNLIFRIDCYKLIIHTPGLYSMLNCNRNRKIAASWIIVSSIQI
ncbi:hypothetical protein BpHYR1_012529 [Brachionus plicatilis]|uniref:Uncharacterized protein n=1 Tax=Brachionus plicatilis TaxID=10195 RepID=A0A3M7SCG2_BRAPC|nr:hypothetical protein BpHYR1_012529 [Brachionus plicatilis]